MSRVPQCLWIGPTHRQEFERALRALRGQYRLVACLSGTPLLRQDLADCPSGSSQSGDAWAPDLVVFAEVTTGELAAELVERVGQRWPAARRLVLRGQWNAGRTANRGAETRGSDPSGQAMSAGVAAHPVSAGPIEAVIRAAEREPVGRHGRPADSEVREPSADGCDRSFPAPKRSLAGCALVVSQDAELASALLEGLWSGGWLGVWAPWSCSVLIEQPTALLVDLPRDESEQTELLCQVQLRYPGVPILGIGSFVRAGEADRLRAHGVREVFVLSWSSQLDALVQSLDQLHSRPSLGQGL
jgi:hypothetical protein